MFGRSGRASSTLAPALTLTMAIGGGFLAPPVAAGDGDGEGGGPKTKTRARRVIERRIEVRSGDEDGRFEGVIVKDGKERRFTSREAFEKALAEMMGSAGSSRRRVRVFRATPQQPGKSGKRRHVIEVVPGKVVPGKRRDGGRAEKGCSECRPRTGRREVRKSRRVRVVVGPGGETRTFTWKSDDDRADGDRPDGFDGPCESEVEIEGEVEVIVEGDRSGARRRRVVLRKLPDSARERIELQIPGAEEGAERDGGERPQSERGRPSRGRGEERRREPGVKKRIVIRRADGERETEREAEDEGERRRVIRKRIEVIVPDGSCPECLRNRLRERAPNMLERWSHGGHPPMRWTPRRPAETKKALEGLPKALPGGLRKAIEKVIRERGRAPGSGTAKRGTPKNLWSKEMPGFDLGEPELPDASRELKKLKKLKKRREVIIVPGRRVVPSQKLDEVLEELRRRVRSLQREIEELERSLVKPRGSLWF